MRAVMTLCNRSAYLLLILPFLLVSCSQRVAPTMQMPTREAQGVVATRVTATGPPPPTATESVPTPGLSPAPTPSAPPDLRYLEAAFQDALASFEAEPGTLAAYYVADLTSGQTIAHDDEVAVSGMSLVKIPILVEVYRTLDSPPTPAQTTLITETATLSGNYTANLLLELIAGRPDPFAGAAVLTASLRRLGLYDTFIAVPYDLEPRPGYLPTYATLANQREASANPDSSMQTTARDLGRLLTWLYRCTQGTGPLLEAGPRTLTASECRELVDVMAQNKIEAFIEAGVPAGVPVAHKHGWVGETHGDAGLVLADGRPYVLVVALHRPGWLEWAESTALIARLSRLAYDHFADPAAYSAARLATPLPPAPVPTATPDLPRAWVVGTRGAGLTLRDAPDGQELLILPEGLQLYLLPEDPVEVGAVPWRQVAVPAGLTGWVGAQYLSLAPPGD